jgi:spore germination cell wall hydrolase CwlJ-like protein
MLKHVLLIILLSLSLQSPAFAEAENRCMASAIFYEANTQSIVGQRAVYDVIINRVRATGKSVCQVISQPYQFSWFDKKPLLPYNTKMKELLQRVESIGRVLINRNYKYFYHESISPKWAKKMDCVKLEEHIFCREETT